MSSSKIRDGGAAPRKTGSAKGKFGIQSVTWGEKKTLSKGKEEWTERKCRRSYGEKKKPGGGCAKTVLWRGKRERGKEKQKPPRMGKEGQKPLYAFNNDRKRSRPAVLRQKENPGGRRVGRPTAPKGGEEKG